ncbi:MAG TPA: non-canonical purine NTP pyrophosphatase [Gemmatimonadales bacterium]|nr:non-canonical purine NTP pyrophosphatase [Gemmatimonadales bacterium]
MPLLIATRNPGKAREIRDLFAGLPITIVFPEAVELKCLPEEEDLEQADSYLGNAVAKARYFAGRSGLATVADDSGIEVDALDGAPGVHSARFAMLHGAVAPGQDLDAANNALLLARLEGVSEEDRTARYRCVVAHLDSATAPPEVVEAACEGRILTAPAGTGGFGYDPLFFSTELLRGFGEVPAAMKHRVSHRGRAFRALIEVLLRRQLQVKK